MSASVESSLPAIDPALSLALRASLALMFATAAYHKSADLPDFRATLGAYRILPDRLIRTVSFAVVGVEAGLAVALLSPGMQAIAATAAAGLLAVYTAAIGVNLARGRRDIDCGCGGSQSKQPIGPGLVLRNGLLFAAALGATAPTTSRGLIWLDAVALAGCLISIALLWTSAHTLLAVTGRQALSAGGTDE